MTIKQKLAYAGVITFCICSARGQNTDTNQPAAAFRGTYATNQVPRSFLGMYAAEFSIGGTSPFNDGFGARSMNQRLWEMNKGYDSIRQWNGHGQEVTGNALGWTFQETVMGYVPVDQLNLESSGTVWNFFLHLFEGSFGNTVHEQAVGDSPIPSYAIAGSAWKKYMDNHVNYGYRILQKKPIAYADIPFGYVDGKEVTRLGTVGCQFASDLMDRKNIGSVNAKPYAILFLSRHLQAQTGISIHPAQLRETGYKRSWFAGIGSVGGPTDFAVGYEASENERRIEGSVHFTF